MRKLLGAAVAAFALLCASSASATRYVTFDFDNGRQVYSTVWEEYPYWIGGGVAANGKFYSTLDNVTFFCCFWSGANYLTSLRSITIQTNHDLYVNRYASNGGLVAEGSPVFQTLTFAPGQFATVWGLWFSNGGKSPFVIDRIVFAVVPEPTTWAMMITGFGLVGGAMRRRRAVVA